MRQEFLTTDAPWAAVIIEVDGGFMAFESENDYRTWNNQQ